MGEVVGVWHGESRFQDMAIEGMRVTGLMGFYEHLGDCIGLLYEGG